MKKFLLTLAALAFATSALMAQTPTVPVQEEPDRVQMRALSMNPSGNDIPTGYDKPQVVNQTKHECKDHKDGQPCTKPADQQCDDCKAKAAAAQKHECKKGEGHNCDKAEGMKHECKKGESPKHECKKGEGHECKEGMAPKHECKKGEGHECKEGMAPKHECKKGEGHECKEGMAPKHECKKGEGHECKEGMAPKHECKKGEGHECKEGAPKQCDKGAIKKMHEECKDHKDGQPCTKPADQQCPDCKKKAKKN